MSQSVTNLPGGMDFLTRVEYSQGDASGVMVSVVVSLFSMFAAVGLLGSLAVSAWNTRKSVNPHLFTRSHVCAYFVSLLICDIIQATGSLMNIRWYANMAVVYEPYCTTQGAIKQLADVSNAAWTFIIALHTFFVVCLRWNPHKWSLWATLISGWSLTFLIVGLGPAAMYKPEFGAFYGISGYWCWIGNNYPAERITLDYMWLFMSALLTFVMYSLVFLVLRGNVTIRGWRVGVHFHRDSSVTGGVDDETISIARQMLLYPIAYTILILPIAFARFVEWSGGAVPAGATFFSDSVFLLSGVVNVTLFVFTRRVLPEHSVLPRSVSMRVPRLPRGKSSKRPPIRIVSVDTFDPNSEKADPEKDDLEKGNTRNSLVQVDLTPRMFQRPESPDSEMEEPPAEFLEKTRIPRVPVPSSPSEPASPPGLSDELSRRLSSGSSEPGGQSGAEDDHHNRDSYCSATSSVDPSSPRSAPPLSSPHRPRQPLAPPMSAVSFVRPPDGGNWM